MKAIDQTTASRRAVLAGLAAAPVVALPDIAGAVFAGPTPSPELAALFEEFLALHAASETWSEEEDVVLYPRLNELADQIAYTPATSLADVVIKLRVYARNGSNIGSHEPFDTELWEMSDDADRDVEERSLIAIARDIHRLGRPDPWA